MAQLGTAAWLGEATVALVSRLQSPRDDLLVSFSQINRWVLEMQRGLPGTTAARYKLIWPVKGLAWKRTLS